MRPRGTIRARLTALYALLVATCTGVLLLISWWILERQLDRTLPAASADDVMGDVTTQYVVAFVGTALVAGAIGWLVAGRVLAPLGRVTATAKRVSEERLDERIPERGPRDELRELSETLNEMLDRLAESFDSQRRFVANASHELRGPLTVIRSEAEVALANPEPDVEELREMAESVAAATRRTEALLQSLLILARSQRGLLRSEPVDLGEVAQCAATWVEREAEAESVRVDVRAAGPVLVDGDVTLLERLVANLAENGVRYNRPGGRVELSVERRGAQALLRVENTGPPVSADDASRLAEPFERLQRVADGRGAGLGLSIVRAVCEAHGGTLAIAPRHGGGLVVTVGLPSSGESSRLSDGSARPARAAR